MSTLTHASVEEVAAFMSDLFGLKVAARDGSEFPEPVAAVATYRDSDQNVRAYLVCDLPCAAVLGAALTQVPMGAVKDSLATGELPENLQENTSEVFNITVNLLPTHLTSRLLLSDVSFGTGIEMPTLTDEAVVDHFQIDVQRYTSGSLSLIQLL